eukprot:gb/GECG01004340.1/.p1 GENE.gb/GECG01004340.1/~~gb/GECG01004340.1/.p1  ORF type:complete len:1162 (+),score=149.75 gb/GECG01004340.1/:1-3486(+)
MSASPVENVQDLRKQISRWKKEFKEEQGREPTKADIDTTPRVKSMLRALQKSASSTSSTTAKFKPTEDSMEAPMAGDSKTTKPLSVSKSKRRRLMLQSETALPSNSKKKLKQESSTAAPEKPSEDKENEPKKEKQDPYAKATENAVEKEPPKKIIAASKLANDKIKRLHRLSDGYNSFHSLRASDNNHNSTKFLGSSQAPSTKDANLTKLNLRRKSWKPNKRSHKKKGYFPRRFTSFTDKVIARDMLFSMFTEASCFAPPTQAMEALLEQGYIVDPHEECKYVPKCSGHALKAAQRTVQKKNSNFGRKFYCCGLGRQDRCNFFMWEEDNVGKTYVKAKRAIEGEKSSAEVNERSPEESCNQITLSSGSDTESEVEDTHEATAKTSTGKNSKLTLRRLLKEHQDGSWITVQNMGQTTTELKAFLSEAKPASTTVHLLSQASITTEETASVFGDSVFLHPYMMASMIYRLIEQLCCVSSSGTHIVVSDEFLLSNYGGLFHQKLSNFGEIIIVLHEADALCHKSSRFEMKMVHATNELCNAFRPTSIVALRQRQSLCSLDERDLITTARNFYREECRLECRDISLRVIPTTKHVKHQQLLELFTGSKKKVKSVMIIVGNAKAADNLTRIFSDHGIEAKAYHKWTTPKQKESIFARFAGKKLSAVVCTLESLHSELITASSTLVLTSAVFRSEVWDTIFCGNTKFPPLVIKWFVPAEQPGSSKELAQDIRAAASQKPGPVSPSFLIAYCKYVHDVMSSATKGLSKGTGSFSHDFLHEVLGIDVADFLDLVLADGPACTDVNTDAPKYCKLRIKTNKLHQHVREDPVFSRLFGIALLMEESGFVKTSKVVKEGHIDQLQKVIAETVTEEYMNIAEVVGSYRSAIKQLCDIDLFEEIPFDGFFVTLVSEQTLDFRLDIAMLCLLWACSPREARVYLPLLPYEEIAWEDVSIEFHWRTSEDTQRKRFSQFAYFPLLHEFEEMNFQKQMSQIRQRKGNSSVSHDNSGLVVNALSMPPLSTPESSLVSPNFQRKLRELVSEVLSRWSDEMILNDDWEGTPEALLLQQFLENSPIMTDLYPHLSKKYQGLEDIKRKVKFLRFNCSNMLYALWDLQANHDDDVACAVVCGLTELSYGQALALLSECIDNWWDANYFDAEEDADGKDHAGRSM